MNGYSPPADGDSNTGPGVLGIVGGVFGTSLLLYLLRIYTRLRPTNRWISSDSIVSLAVVSATSTQGGERICMLTTRAGNGNHRFFAVRGCYHRGTWTS